MQNISIEQINKYIKQIEPRVPIRGDLKHPHYYIKDVKFDEDGVSWEEVFYDGGGYIRSCSYCDLDAGIEIREGAAAERSKYLELDFWRLVIDNGFGGDSHEFHCSRSS